MTNLRSLFAFRKSVFICHASDKRDADMAESLALRFRRQGFKVFLDRDNLQPGHTYDDRILKEIIGQSSAFVFLISPASVAPGRYTLTEMEFAKRRWPDPHGAVLPVLIAETDFQNIPPYLRAVTVSQTQGDVVAHTAAEVARMLPRAANRRWIVAAAAAGLTAALVAVFLAFKPFHDWVYAHGSWRQEPKIVLDDPVDPQRSKIPPEQKTTPDDPQPKVAATDAFPPNFDLIFSLDLSDDTPYLAKDQVHIVVSAKRWENYIGLHPDGFYVEPFETPGKATVFSAFATRKILTGYNAAPPITSFCLRRGDHPPSDAALRSAVLRCKEGDQPCATFDAADPGLLGASPACGKVGGLRHSGSLGVRSLLAGLLPGAAAAAAQARVWSVPSLDSLRQRKDANELRDGFTVFTIRSAGKLDIDADAVGLDLAVNDTPVLIEGLPAALQPRAVDLTQPIALQFGLQNLDFDGRDAGCDRITSRLQFYKAGEEVGQPIALELRYAALRAVDAIEFKSGLGTFRGSASYEVSSTQSKRTDWRVFVRTAPRSAPAQLARARQQIDDLALVYGTGGHDYPVRAVLRPPLRGGWGLALGLVQESGQIRFTFTNEEASALRNFARQQWRSSAAVKQLFDRQPDLYQEPADADRRYSCAP